MKTWLAMLCTCLALGLVAAGCGSSDDNDSSSSDTAKAPASTPPTDTGTSGSGGATSGAKGVPVVMKDITFKPGNVTVKKGGTVTWTNDDSVGHDVTKVSGPGPSFKSGSAGDLNGGDTYQHKFTTPGTIKYVCTVHPGMEGTVVVK